MAKNLCGRDTNGDGDCHSCARHGGCYLSVFQQSDIDAATLSREQVIEFKKSAVKFEYSEWLGTVKGWRNAAGQVLIESVEKP